MERGVSRRWQPEQWQRHSSGRRGKCRQAHIAFSSHLFKVPSTLRGSQVPQLVDLWWLIFTVSWADGESPRRRTLVRAFPEKFSQLTPAFITFFVCDFKSNVNSTSHSSCHTGTNLIITLPSPPWWAKTNFLPNVQSSKPGYYGLEPPKPLH